MDVKQHSTNQILQHPALSPGQLPPRRANGPTLSISTNDYYYYCYSSEKSKGNQARRASSSDIAVQVSKAKGAAEGREGAADGGGAQTPGQTAGRAESPCAERLTPRKSAGNVPPAPVTASVVSSAKDWDKLLPPRLVGLPKEMQNLLMGRKPVPPVPDRRLLRLFVAGEETGELQPPAGVLAADAFVAVVVAVACCCCCCLLLWLLLLAAVAVACCCCCCLLLWLLLLAAVAVACCWCCLLLLLLLAAVAVACCCGCCCCCYCAVALAVAVAAAACRSLLLLL